MNDVDLDLERGRIEEFPDIVTVEDDGVDGVLALVFVLAFVPLRKLMRFPAAEKALATNPCPSPGPSTPPLLAPRPPPLPPLPRRFLLLPVDDGSKLFVRRRPTSPPANLDDSVDGENGIVEGGRVGGAVETSSPSSRGEVGSLAKAASSVSEPLGLDAPDDNGERL